MTDYTRDKRKLSDWRALNLESDWNEARIKYTEDNASIFTHTILPLYHIEELTIDPDDYIPLNDVYEKEGGNQYAYGYNEKMGDKGSYPAILIVFCLFVVVVSLNCPFYSEFYVSNLCAFLIFVDILTKSSPVATPHKKNDWIM